MSARIFVAFVHDRHADAEVATFSTRKAAIKWATAYMKHSVAHPKDLKVEDDGTRWTMFYEEESDNAFVVETELDSEP